ncbi:MAG TPA: (Fe-S)-binding protein [Chloroflexia bacterium]|nr:(Fe-S)-binding protein [Chloroflexia bacterium]
MAVHSEIVSLLFSPALATANDTGKAANNSIIGILLFLLVLAGAIYYFTVRVMKLIKVIQQGKPEVRTDNPGERTGRFLKGVLFQERLWRDIWPGTAHVITFWGFLVIQFGLLEFAINGLTGWEVPLLSSRPFFWMLDAVAVLVLLALVYFSIRRAFVKPRQLTTTRDAWIIIVLIALVCVTLLFEEAMKWAVTTSETAGYHVLGWRIGKLLFPNAPVESLQWLWTVSWWAHMLVVLGFLVYLPSSKHLHLLSSPFTTYFQNLRPKGQMRNIENIEDLEHYGANKIEDFTWKDLLDTYACTECGRCTAVCPANQTGKPLNPKKIVIDLKTTLFAQSGLGMVGHSAGHGGTKTDDASMGGPLEKGTPATVAVSSATAAVATHGAADSGGDMAVELPPLVGGMITQDELWSCTTCRACMTECPVFIEHVPKIVDMRRYLVLDESEFPPEVTPLFNNLERNGNPWTMRPEERMEWTEKVPFDVKVMAELDEGQEVDVLFWVGCMGALDQRNKKVTQNLAMILEEAGLNWAILGPEESCSGDPARRIGNEYLYQMLAQQNIEVLNGYKENNKIRTIVTACPHCFNTIKNEYPQFNGNFEVVHHTQLLAKLVEEGKLKTSDGLGDKKITYHDPCYLGRYNDIYDAPRFVLNSLGNGIKKVDLVEMPRHKSKSFCCGGGGGRAWMEEHIGTRVNQTRIQEAADTGAEVVAAGCPFCITMFEDGIKGKGLEEKLQVLDVTELIQISRKPAATPSTEGATES